MDNMRSVGIVFLVGSVMSACSSITPTKEFTEGYRIYDLKGVESIRALSKELKSTLQKNSDKATFSNNIPPHPLPEKPARFSLVNPFGKSGLGALMALPGTSMKIPKCDDSLFSGMTQDNFNGSENTIFFICLQPYKYGYHMDIYYSFTKVSGGFSPESLGRSLAQSTFGDSSQFIPRTIAELESAAKKSGANVSLVESYP